MQKQMGGLVFAVAIAFAIASQHPGAQTAAPYKLGMFEQNGRAFVGMVINNDSQVVDLSRANVNAPATLKQLIAGWDAKMGSARRWRRSRPRRSRSSR